MALTDEQRLAKNKRIADNGKATRERHKTMDAVARTVKVDYAKLSDEQRDALNGCFRDAKHLYNDIVLFEGEMKDYVIPQQVMVRMPDGSYEPRALDSLGSQMKQSILQRAKGSIKGLHTLKEHGHKVGALKPVKYVESIPLPQFGITIRFGKKPDGSENRNWVHIQNIPGYMHVTGAKQIAGDVEFASMATLIRKPDGYYIAFTMYVDRGQHKAERELKQALRRAKLEKVIPEGGLDANVRHPIVESDGTEHTDRFPVTPKARRAQRKMARRGKDTPGGRRAEREYRIEMERLKRQRDAVALAVFIAVMDKFEHLYIQDENIHSWMKRDGYARGGRKLSGGIVGRLYALLRKQPPEKVTILDVHQPTTAWCPVCGRRTKHRPGLETYRCAYCGHTAKRDVHAANNMIILGHHPLTYEELRLPRDIPIGPYRGLDR